MNVYESIMEGLNEAVEYEKGNIKCRRIKISSTPVPEMDSAKIEALRKELCMSREVFGFVVGVSEKTVSAWENGKSRPSGAARRMLSLLRADPKLPEKYGIYSKKEAYAWSYEKI